MLSRVTPNAIINSHIIWFHSILLDMRQSVSPEDCRMDEHGNAIHTECYDARQKLKQAGLSANEGRKPRHRLRSD